MILPTYTELNKALLNTNVYADMHNEKHACKQCKESLYMSIGVKLTKLNLLLLAIH